MTSSPPWYTQTHLAVSFESVVAQYAAARPGYPPALFEAVEELAGRPLAGARTLDAGAGTGIATRLLAGRGARVTAMEPGPGMAAQLRGTAPAGVTLVRGDGNALPFADATFDLVTYAQAWHWTRPADSVPEALRVLRPGGALALWWNVSDESVPWTVEQDERLKRAVSDYHGRTISGDSPDILRGLGHTPAVRRIPWSRTVSLERHLESLASHSFLAALGPEGARPVLEAERAELLALFPDGSLTEPYVTELTVVRKPRHRP